MKLYAYRYCPFSRRARIALDEKDVDFEYVELEPMAKHPKEILGKTPTQHGVPVLEVRDDFVVWDSAAILSWLDKAYPNSLLPSAMDAIALADAWVAWTSSKLYPPMKSLTPGSPHGGDEKAKTEATKKLLDALREAAPLFPHDDGWMIGGVFSQADVAMAPALAVLDDAMLAKIPPNVRAYVERLRARPSIRAVCELDRDRPSRAA